MSDTGEDRRGEDFSGSENGEEKRNAEEEDFEEVVPEAASSTLRRLEPPKQQNMLHIPEVVDDFLRNFLRRLGLNRTLRSFEAEWYGSAQRPPMDPLSPVGTTDPGVVFIPDAFTHMKLLQCELDSVHREMDVSRQEVRAAAESLVRTQRERDFHQLQYRRVADQKNKLVDDWKQMREHLRSYEPLLRQLEDKYQTALRQKVLIGLQKGYVQSATDQGRSKGKNKEKKENIFKGKRAEKSPAKNNKSHQPNEFPVRGGLVRPQQAQKKPGEAKNIQFL
ncbi:sperm-associated antigen 16 protein-like [Menidia menidia]